MGLDWKKLSELLFPDIEKTPADYEAQYPPRQLPEGAVVTRMAPSPTGFVHLGNLVQGLTAERLAHQSGGVLFLRVEDTDAKREVAGAVEILIDALQYYHIRFDEGATVEGNVGDYGPYRQRQRRDIYRAYAKTLVEQGLAYPCFCTEQELADMHRQQEQQKANFGYFGKWAIWRDRPLEDIQPRLEAGEPWVLRFRSTGSIENKIRFTDLIKGKLELTENDIDHVLLKSDGIPTYHFAHVIDDHLMRTTHVVRGDEWLSTLPFHLQLFRALGFKPPKYLHIGPLMKMDGISKRKLSKRKDPELALTFYQAEGFPPESVYEYLMTVLNSNFEDWRRANADADIQTFQFSVKKMNPAGALFDPDKLKDVSRNVISRMDAAQVTQQVLEWAQQYDPGFYALLAADQQYTAGIFDIDRGGKKPRKDLAKWSEAKGYAAYFFDALFEQTDCWPEHLNTADIKGVLQRYMPLYDPADDKDTWFSKIRGLCEPLGFSANVKAYKQDPTGFKGHVGDVSTVIRVAVTGRVNTPDLYAIMQLLGRQRVLERLQQASERL